jgi:NADH-quinone oxidoreductase subunit C
MSDVADTAEQTAPETPREELYGCPVVDSLGQRVILVSRDRYVDVMKKLADDTFDLLVDLTAVDYSQMPQRVVGADIPPERFEIVVSVTSMQRRERIRVRVQVPEDDAQVPTLFDLHPGTEALEREVFDMFGITFAGHPDPTRILMPEDWDGHPLRKDYSVGRIPVQFKGAHS